MKDVLIRALKTFLQAGIAVIVLSFQNGVDITNKEALYSVGIAALSAALSALHNFIIKSLKKAGE